MSSKQKRWASVDKASIPIETLVDRYLSACYSAGMSPKTLRGYREKLTRYVRVVGGTLGDFNRDTLREHLASLLRARKWDMPTPRGTAEAADNFWSQLVETTRELTYLSGTDSKGRPRELGHREAYAEVTLTPKPGQPKVENPESCWAVPQGIASGSSCQGNCVAATRCSRASKPRSYPWHPRPTGTSSRSGTRP